ncbi:hypothetical protein [Zavarzinella formosa]|uniref:hypothetical protein n=1 Tax=Zavarzinella formosa TaxID=360055 RepID=UPI0002F34CD5|nr:hypothetical protein [Zavarzinella formosa]
MQPTLRNLWLGSLTDPEATLEIAGMTVKVPVAPPVALLKPIEDFYLAEHFRRTESLRNPPTNPATYITKGEPL